ncbi:MAG: preQ(1) synthase [candidate division NC10 bacterium]
MPTKASKQLATFPNPNPERDYEISFECPEFTCLCPMTGQPDFATLHIRYVPDRLCVELKSLKYYILAYRNLGIFYENAVNRILDDVGKACRPKWAIVRGAFTTRGGMCITIEARYPRRR